MGRDAAQTGQTPPTAVDGWLSHAALDCPMVLPVLPHAAGQIAVLCSPAHLASAERELVTPLVEAGFQVTLGLIAPGRALETPDPSCRAVLLDMAPEDPHRFGTCADLRARLGCPLMLVLRRAAGNDPVRGYEAGADSCLLAPFDVREFLARLGALLRRQPITSPDTPPTE